jgi:23S rRNA pseudouridine1911/1915/1917 synthase
VTIDEVVPNALAGERLDRIVALLLDVSRADAAALIAAGGVAVDGVVAGVGKVRLVVDQVVTLQPTLLPMASSPQGDPSVVLNVVYADEYLLVVDKPAGLVVHPGAGNPGGTLVNGLLAAYPEVVDVGERTRPGIVHRLDAGTSGLLAVARTQEAYSGLVAMLSDHDVERTYIALVWGHLANTAGVVDAPIGRDHRDPMKMAVVVDGKPARTHFCVVEAFRTPANVSVVRCQLETGRTHQIRVHLAAIGHPVVGDGTYGGNREALPMARPFLHAAHLRFVHPVTGIDVDCHSDVPNDLQSVMGRLSDPIETTG